jgi:hypothetical protein
MDEPVGHTIDGTPWEEARGPHLPDPLTRVPAKLPRTSWAFVILAVATGLVQTLDRVLPLWPDTETDIGPYVRAVLSVILSIIPTIATILFGAALFARHPRAWTTHRALTVGLVLLAVAGAMQAVTGRVAELFLVVTTPADDLTFLTPGLIAYTLMTALLATLGTFYVARGVRTARLRTDPQGGSRWTTTIALVATLLTLSTIVGGIVTIARVSAAAGDVYFGYNVAILAVSWLTLAAQAYLAVVMWSGMAAGEEPARAWGLGTVGVWLILLGSSSTGIASAALYVVATPGMDFTIWSWIALIWTTITVVGYVLLLAAFTRGLPSAPNDDRPAFVG